MQRLAAVGAIMAMSLMPLQGAWAASVNGANDFLQSQSPAAQAKFLAKAVGKACTGKNAYFMGINVVGVPARQALWSVRCTNGSSYAVKVKPNGTTQAIECTVFLGMDGIKCFTKAPLRK